MEPDTKDSAETVRQYNVGARLADDCFCQLCGVRGVFGTYCRDCSQGLYRSYTSWHDD